MILLWKKKSLTGRLKVVADNGVLALKNKTKSLIVRYRNIAETSYMQQQINLKHITKITSRNSCHALTLCTQKGTILAFLSAIGLLFSFLDSVYIIP